jgi:hypothetical protein
MGMIGCDEIPVENHQWPRQIDIVFLVVIIIFAILGISIYYHIVIVYYNCL